jgi:hypothetical protein
MKIFKWISFGESGPTCQQCAHFQNDPAFIEETYRGLTTMSSGFASVRHRDGLCSYNQLYLSAKDSCPGFTPRSLDLNKQQVEKAVANNS